MSDINAIESLIGREATAVLVKHFAGCSVYIPSKAWLYERNADMIERYKSGKNYRAIALEFKLSENYVRNIIHGYYKIKQPSLF